MHILISSSTYAPAMNGQAVFTTNLAEGLVKLGHQVLVVLDSHHVDASLQIVNGVQIVETKSVNLGILHKGTYFSPFPGREIKKLFDSFRPEVVHIQDHYPSCRAVVREAEKRRIKIVGSNHFLPENLAPYVPGISKIKPVFNWVLWQWMLEVYRRVDAISAQSDVAAELIRQQGLKMPVISISCGIDLDQFYPNPSQDRKSTCKQYGIDPNKKIFLFLGRVDGEKRIDLLIRALKRLQREDIQLIVAGRGKVENTLHRLVKELGLADQVSFTGFVPQESVALLMNTADVFVMPSEAELLSISSLEAMACGKPVLLADALALPELVEVGVNGYLFKPGDINDLARWMKHLADHPEEWEKMGKASLALAQAHSLDETIRKFDHLYSRLVSELPVTEVKSPIKESVN